MVTTFPGLTYIIKGVSCLRNWDSSLVGSITRQFGAEALNDSFTTFLIHCGKYKLSSYLIKPNKLIDCMSRRDS